MHYVVWFKATTLKIVRFARFDCVLFACYFAASIDISSFTKYTCVSVRFCLFCLRSAQTANNSAISIDGDGVQNGWRAVQIEDKTIDFGRTAIKIMFQMNVSARVSVRGDDDQKWNSSTQKAIANRYLLFELRFVWKMLASSEVPSNDWRRHELQTQTQLISRVHCIFPVRITFHFDSFFSEFVLFLFSFLSVPFSLNWVSERWTMHRIGTSNYTLDRCES